MTPLTEPVPMILVCEICRHQHIDAPSEGWDNPPHHTHLCQFCGFEWRPRDYRTTGVASLEVE